MGEINSQPIIDFRVRPPYKGNWDLFKNEKGEYAGIKESFYKYNLRYEGSVTNFDYDLFIKELDEVNIVKAGVPGRNVGGITNDELFELADREPDRFIPFPFLNPVAETALDDIDRLVINGKGKGVVIEASFTAAGFFEIDDERIDTVYKKLGENRIPVIITISGLASPDFDIFLPQRVNNIARKFPQLNIVVVHGGWPWVLEFIGVAFNNKNVYLAPDIYATNGPGARDYAIAANTVLKDQMIFASSYPIATNKEVLEIIRNKWGLTEENFKKFTYQNAAKLLGIE